MRNKSVGSKSTTLNNCVFEDVSSPSMNTPDTLRGKHFLFVDWLTTVNKCKPA